MKWSSILRALATGTQQDFRTLGSLALGYLITGAVPPKQDHRVLRRLLQTPFGVRPACVRTAEQRMRALLGTPTGRSNFHRDAVGFCEMQREIQWLHWRALHGRALSAETSVDGAARVADALGQGNGVVFWGLSFCGTLLVKVALQRAGVELVHLSATDHGAGFPTTRLGYELIGPLYCVAENRYLKERVVFIQQVGAASAVRTLIHRLNENQCVYIAGERTSARNNMSAPLFDRSVAFATGAPALAWKVGSALFPVHVIREGALRYRAIVGERIETDRDSDKVTFVQGAVAEFARYLEDAILEDPSDWDWRWNTVERLLNAPA